MFVITGASGNTGSVVAKTLLSHKVPVRVLLRSDAKAASWRSHGAEVALGDVESADALSAAFAGASGAYLMLPGDYGSADPMGRARRVCDNFIAALEKTRVPHVTLLSSIGAELSSGNGIVATLHIVEERVKKLGIGFTALRAAYFMENWASSLGMALQSGMLYGFLGPADKKIPMVATHDIGIMGAYSLLFPTSSHRIIELAGPEDYSPNDAAAALTHASGKPIGAGVAPVEGMAPMLTQFGMSAQMAAEMVGLTSAINAGHINFGKPGATLVRGSTSLAHVFAGLLKGAAT